MGGHELPPPSLHSSLAVGEAEPPTLLARLMAAARGTLPCLRHFPPHRLASFAQPGPAWPAHRSNPSSPLVEQRQKGRKVQVQQGSKGGHWCSRAPAREEQGRPWLRPSPLCPLSWRSQKLLGGASRQLQAVRKAAEAGFSMFFHVS